VAADADTGDALVTPPPVAVREAEPQDVPALLAMFRELAEYEDLEHALRATEERLHDALFGEHPAARALIAVLGSQIVGYAVFFTTFSTFLAARGVWLEDLYVRPAHRGSGAGRALLATVAAQVGRQERLEWSALDWNEPALGFYRHIGAQTMSDWITHRLVGEDLARLAAGASDSYGAPRR
jgi:GNAT superfamily N-acetyltransferase